MKKALFILMLLTTSFTKAQRFCDLTLYGGVTGTVITIDPEGITPVHFDFYFLNDGPDTLRVTDTLHLISPFLDDGKPIFISPVVLPPNSAVRIIETFYFKEGWPAGFYTFCDSVWLTSISADTAIDPDLANNILCRDFDVVHKTTSITGQFGRSEQGAGKALSIIPNPAAAAVQFDFVAEGGAEVIATVQDLSGRRVLSKNYGRAYNPQFVYSLDIASLTPGLYFITLSQEGRRCTGKLWKQ